MSPGIVGPDGETFVGGAPTEEELAFAMHKARERMLKESMNAARNQLDHVTRMNALPIDVNSATTQAMLAAMAAASVTAAQLLVESSINSFAKRLAEIVHAGKLLEERVAALETKASASADASQEWRDHHERIAALEVAGAQVSALGAQLERALAAIEIPTPEEFERIQREAFGHAPKAGG